MSARPSSIATNVRRYETGLKSPTQPPGTIRSPNKPRRRMSVMSAEIARLSPDSDKAHEYPSMPPKSTAKSAASDGGGGSGGAAGGGGGGGAGGDGGGGGGGANGRSSRRETAKAARAQSARSRSPTQSPSRSPPASPQRSATSRLKSLGGSSYDLGSFYSSFNEAPAPAAAAAPGERSPRGPKLSPQVAEAQRKSVRRNRRGRRTVDGEGKVVSAEDDKSLRSKSSKLQLLDDLLAQVKSTNEMFHDQLHDAKKDAKRIVKRSEREGRRLTYTKSLMDDALHGARDSVSVLQSLAARHTLGALPERGSHKLRSPPKMRWRRALRKICFKHAVARTSLDLLARSEKAQAAKARSRANSRASDGAAAAAATRSREIDNL